MKFKHPFVYMFITLMIGLVNISLSSAEYENEITDDAIEDSKYVLQNHLNQKVYFTKLQVLMIKCIYSRLNDADIEYFHCIIYL